MRKIKRQLVLNQSRTFIMINILYTHLMGPLKKKFSTCLLNFVKMDLWNENPLLMAEQEAITF